MSKSSIVLYVAVFVLVISCGNYATKKTQKTGKTLFRKYNQRNNVKPFLVNEKVSLASERPFWVEYAKQKESTGIKNWEAPNLE